MALVLCTAGAMAQNVVYQRNATTYSADQLNALTEATMIAVKNLSGTNNRYLAGNTNIEDFGYEAVLVWEPAVENTAGTYHIRRLSAGENGYIQAAASGAVTLGAKATAQVFVAVTPTAPGNEALSGNNGILVRFKQNSANTWLNCQAAANTPVLGNTGQGGWTMHNVYGVDVLTSTEVTYVYKLDGVEKKRATIEQAIGSDFNAPAIPYVTFDYPEGKVTAETTTVEVTCTQNLPFVLSESYADAKWYYMTIRSNGQKYVSRSETAPYNNSATIPYGANGRWAFTGNVFDGIKVLNNGAGANQTLGYDATETASNIYMKDGETYWIIEEGNGGFLLRQSGATEYAHDYSSKLQFWNNSGAATDAGSAFIAYPAEDIEAAFDIVNWKEGELAYLGYVGGYAEDLKDEIEAVENFAGYENFVTNNAYIAVNTDSYYRIVCVHPKPGNSGDASYNTLTFDGNANLVTAPTSSSNINQIFKFKDAGEGKFYLKNMNADGYLDKISAGPYRSAIVTETDACKLELSTYGAAQWKLKNSEGEAVHCLFAENHPTESVPYACAGWEAGKGSASAWYIIPATDIEITVNEYATVYLPFAVSVEGATAYAVEETNSTHAIFAEKADIPANEGAIIAGNGTAKLNIISAATSDWSENMLEGTTISQDVTPEGTGYVLSKQDNNIGFYRAVTDGKAEGTFLNNANKAYLVVPTAQAEGIASYSFRFGEGTTGISEVKGESGNVKVIYDLTGRKVETISAPGIYIVGGKKVLVK